MKEGDDKRLVTVLENASEPPAPFRWSEYPGVSSLSHDFVVINRRKLDGLCNGSSCPHFYIVVVLHSSNLEQTVASIILPSTVE